MCVFVSMCVHLRVAIKVIKSSWSLNHVIVQPSMLVYGWALNSIIIMPHELWPVYLNERVCVCPCELQVCACVLSRWQETVTARPSLTESLVNVSLLQWQSWVRTHTRTLVCGPLSSLRVVVKLCSFPYCYCHNLVAVSSHSSVTWIISLHFF